MTNSKNQTIETIHDFFFSNLQNSPSFKEIVVCFEKNNLLIDEILLDKNNLLFEQTVRIKSEYCFALAEVKNYTKLHTIINDVVRLFDEIYDTEKGKFNNAFFEKLIFQRMVTSYEMNELENAKLDLKDLLKYYPKNKIYLNWSLFFKKKNKKSLISRLFGHRCGTVPLR